MQRLNAPSAAAAALLLATVFAGCSGGGAAGGFTATEPGAPGEPWVFAAKASGDEYKWDFGDHLGKAMGKRAEYAYDVDHGNVTVSLEVKNGDVTKRYTKVIELGAPGNELPSLVFEVSSNWATVGEKVRLSGAASRDPEGDPLRFAFGCVRTGEIVLQAPGHVHPKGPPPATGPGSVLARVAPLPLGAPQKELGSDLCAALSSPAPGLDATVEGSFSRTGVYNVYMFAGDPFESPATGQVTVYVTEDRPPRRVPLLYSGTLVAGQGGQVQDTIDGVPVENPVGQPVALDKESHTFTMPLDNEVSYLNLTYATDAAELTQLSWGIYQEERRVAFSDTTNQVLLAADTLKRGGTYRLEVVLVNGANVAYEVELVHIHNLDPTRLY